jgi:hypothetical protein
MHPGSSEQKKVEHIPVFRMLGEGKGIIARRILYEQVTPFRDRGEIIDLV